MVFMGSGYKGKGYWKGRKGDGFEGGGGVITLWRMWFGNAPTRLLI
ncbi:hypothetical protein ID0278_12600 [Helicobacter pylori]